MNLSAKRIARLGLFVALLIVSAKITIPMVPVPMTLQSLTVIFFACFLGFLDSAIGVAVYIALGLLGLPVFASGSAGIAYVIKPSFGFTIGFFVACFASGLIYRKGGKIIRTIIAVTAGTISIYIVGIAYFLLLKTFYFGDSFEFWNVLLTFWIVFIPSDILKGVICVLVLKRLEIIKTSPDE